jgi:amino acid transporter
VIYIVPDSHQSFNTVFTKTINNSGFSHQWLWFGLLLGLLQAQYTYTGYDAAAHMSEETRNASRAAAQGVVMSIVVSAIFGYILALGVTFAIQSFDATTGAGLVAVKWFKGPIAQGTTEELERIEERLPTRTWCRRSFCTPGVGSIA